MSHVSKFYTALASQIQGLYWKDGGPIVAIQVKGAARLTIAENTTD